MAYDALGESVRLIESRRLEPVQRLSRRRRFAAMAVDVADDVAVTMFARRGVGCLWSETHVLVKRHGTWHIFGGGGSSADEDLLAHRPAHLPEGRGPSTSGGVDPRIVTVEGGGGVRDHGGRPGRWPWSGRWISYAVVRVNGEVASVGAKGRDIDVPWHGRVVILTARRGPSKVTLRDGTGGFLGEARLRGPRG